MLSGHRQIQAPDKKTAQPCWIRPCRPVVRVVRPTHRKPPDRRKTMHNAAVPQYLFKIPAEAPAGKVVVHNNVRPSRQLGSNGFRAWLAEPNDRLEACS